MRKRIFNAKTLETLNETYKPQVIFIEYNGTWGMDTLKETELPEGWVIVQSLATADATTFEMYLANMRTMIMEQLFDADVVILTAAMMIRRGKNSAGMSKSTEPESTDRL